MKTDQQYLYYKVVIMNACFFMAYKEKHRFEFWRIFRQNLTDFWYETPFQPS